MKRLRLFTRLCLLCVNWWVQDEVEKTNAKSAQATLGKPLQVLCRKIEENMCFHRANMDTAHYWIITFFAPIFWSTGHWVRARNGSKGRCVPRGKTGTDKINETYQSMADWRWRYQFPWEQWLAYIGSLDTSNVITKLHTYKAHDYIKDAKKRSVGELLDVKDYRVFGVMMI